MNGLQAVGANKLWKSDVVGDEQKLSMLFVGLSPRKPVRI